MRFAIVTAIVLAGLRGICGAAENRGPPDLVVRGLIIGGEPYTLAVVRPPGNEWENRGGIWSKALLSERVRSKAYRFYYRRKKIEEERLFPKGYVKKLKEADAKTRRRSYVLVLFKGLGFGQVEGMLEFTARSTPADLLPYESALELEPPPREIREEPYPILEAGEDGRPKLAFSSDPVLTGETMEINKLAARKGSRLNIPLVLESASLRNFKGGFSPAGQGTPTFLLPGEVPQSVAPARYRIQCARNETLIKYYEREIGFKEIEPVLKPGASASARYWHRTTAIMEISREDYVRRIAERFPQRESGRAFWDASVIWAQSTNVLLGDDLEGQMLRSLESEAWIHSEKLHDKLESPLRNQLLKGLQRLDNTRLRPGPPKRNGSVPRR